VNQSEKEGKGQLKRNITNGQKIASTKKRRKIHELTRGAEQLNHAGKDRKKARKE